MAYIVPLHLTKPLTPGLDRCFAHTVLLCHLRDSYLISLSEDPDNLLVAVSAILHGNSFLGGPDSQVSTGPLKGKQVRLRVGFIAGLGLNDVLDSGGNLKEVVELRREIVKNRKNYAIYLMDPELREALLDFLEDRPESEVDCI